MAMKIIASLLQPKTKEIYIYIYPINMAPTKVINLFLSTFKLSMSYRNPLY